MLLGRPARLGSVGLGRRSSAFSQDWSSRAKVGVANLQAKHYGNGFLISLVKQRRSNPTRGIMASSEAAGAAEAAGLEVVSDGQLAGVAGNAIAAEKPSSKKKGGGDNTASVSPSLHGFSRPEVNSQPLVGSVNLYERHVFLCYKEAESWPAQVEGADFDRLPRHLVAALRARKGDMPKKTRLTICEGRDGTDSSIGDVLIFPEMLRYRGLTHFDVDTFVDDVLVKGNEWVGSKPEFLSGSHIFVCAHGSRDARCGVCGPELIEKLQQEICLRGLEGQIFVRPCSHIGGHKYAGNLIVFSSTGTDPVSGHWYGYVTPNDVPIILDQHIGKGEIIDRLWRGQMGINEADQKQAQQDRLQSWEDGKLSCGCNGSQNQLNGVKGQSGSACCQSREPVVEENAEAVGFIHTNGLGEHDGHLIPQSSLEPHTHEEVATVPQNKIWGYHLLRLPNWTQTWEREDTHAALAVIGAAAAVAIAFHVYKHS